MRSLLVTLALLAAPSFASAQRLPRELDTLQWIALGKNDAGTTTTSVSKSRLAGDEHEAMVWIKVTYLSLHTDTIAGHVRQWDTFFVHEGVDCAKQRRRLHEVYTLRDGAVIDFQEGHTTEWSDLPHRATPTTFSVSLDRALCPPA
jgi:hypothetical protein